MNQNLCSENNIFRAKFNYSPVCTSIITVEQNSKIPMTNLKTYSKLMLQLFFNYRTNGFTDLVSEVASP